MGATNATPQSNVRTAAVGSTTASRGVRSGNQPSASPRPISSASASSDPQNKISYPTSTLDDAEEVAQFVRKLFKLQRSWNRSERDGGAANEGDSDDDMFLQGDEPPNPLLDAVVVGSEELVYEILRSGVFTDETKRTRVDQNNIDTNKNVNKQDEHKKNALPQSGGEGAASYLFPSKETQQTQHGIDRASGPSQETALHVACRLNRSQIVALLLSAGADPNKKDASGFTALHHAMIGGSNISPYANTGTSSDGNTIATNETAAREMAESEASKVVVLLLEFGADPNSCAIDGVSILQYAIQQHQFTLALQLLVKYRLRITSATRAIRGETPLSTLLDALLSHFAVEHANSAHATELAKDGLVLASELLLQQSAAIPPLHTYMTIAQPRFAWKGIATGDQLANILIDKKATIFPLIGGGGGGSSRDDHEKCAKTNTMNDTRKGKERNAKEDHCDDDVVRSFVLSDERSRWSTACNVDEDKEMSPESILADLSVLPVAKADHRLCGRAVPVVADMSGGGGRGGTRSKKFKYGEVEGIVRLPYTLEELGQLVPSFGKGLERRMAKLRRSGNTWYGGVSGFESTKTIENTLEGSEGEKATATGESIFFDDVRVQSPEELDLRAFVSVHMRRLSLQWQRISPSVRNAAVDNVLSRFNVEHSPSLLTQAKLEGQQASMRRAILQEKDLNRNKPSLSADEQHRLSIGTNGRNVEDRIFGQSTSSPEIGFPFALSENHNWAKLVSQLMLSPLVLGAVSSSANAPIKGSGGYAARGVGIIGALPPNAAHVKFGERFSCSDQPSSLLKRVPDRAAVAFSPSTALSRSQTLSLVPSMVFSSSGGKEGRSHFFNEMPLAIQTYVEDFIEFHRRQWSSERLAEEESKTHTDSEPYESSEEPKARDPFRLMKHVARTSGTPNAILAAVCGPEEGALWRQRGKLSYRGGPPRPFTRVAYNQLYLHNLLRCQTRLRLNDATFAERFEEEQWVANKNSGKQYKRNQGSMSDDTTTGRSAKRPSADQASPTQTYAPWYRDDLETASILLRGYYGKRVRIPTEALAKIEHPRGLYGSPLDPHTLAGAADKPSPTNVPSVMLNVFGEYVSVKQRTALADYMIHVRSGCAPTLPLTAADAHVMLDSGEDGDDSDNDYTCMSYDEGEYYGNETFGTHTESNNKGQGNKKGAGHGNWQRLLCRWSEQENGKSDDCETNLSAAEVRFLCAGVDAEAIDQEVRHRTPQQIGSYLPENSLSSGGFLSLVFHHFAEAPPFNPFLRKNYYFTWAEMRTRKHYAEAHVKRPTLEYLVQRDVRFQLLRQKQRDQDDTQSRMDMTQRIGNGDRSTGGGGFSHTPSTADVGDCGQVLLIDLFGAAAAEVSEFGRCVLAMVKAVLSAGCPPRSSVPSNSGFAYGAACQDVDGLTSRVDPLPHPPLPKAHRETRVPQCNERYEFISQPLPNLTWQEEQEEIEYQIRNSRESRESADAFTKRTTDTKTNVKVNAPTLSELSSAAADIHPVNSYRRVFYTQELAIETLQRLMGIMNGTADDSEGSPSCTPCSTASSAIRLALGSLVGSDAHATKITGKTHSPSDSVRFMHNWPFGCNTTDSANEEEGRPNPSPFNHTLYFYQSVGSVIASRITTLNINDDVEYCLPARVSSNLVVIYDTLHNGHRRERMTLPVSSRLEDNDKSKSTAGVDSAYFRVLPNLPLPLSSLVGPDLPERSGDDGAVQNQARTPGLQALDSCPPKTHFLPPPYPPRIAQSLENAFYTHASLETVTPTATARSYSDMLRLWEDVFKAPYAALAEALTRSHESCQAFVFRNTAGQEPNIGSERCLFCDTSESTSGLPCVHITTGPLRAALFDLIQCLAQSLALARVVLLAVLPSEHPLTLWVRTYLPLCGEYDGEEHGEDSSPNRAEMYHKPSGQNATVSSAAKSGTQFVGDVRGAGGSSRSDFVSKIMETLNSSVEEKSGENQRSCPPLREALIDNLHVVSKAMEVEIGKATQLHAGSEEEAEETKRYVAQRREERNTSHDAISNILRSVPAAQNEAIVAAMTGAEMMLPPFIPQRAAQKQKWLKDVLLLKEMQRDQQREAEERRAAARKKMTSIEHPLGIRPPSSSALSRSRYRYNCIQALLHEMMKLLCITTVVGVANSSPPQLEGGSVVGTDTKTILRDKASEGEVETMSRVMAPIKKTSLLPTATSIFGRLAAEALQNMQPKTSHSCKSSSLLSSNSLLVKAVAKTAQSMSVIHEQSSLPLQSMLLTVLPYRAFVPMAVTRAHRRRYEARIERNGMVKERFLDLQSSSREAYATATISTIREVQLHVSPFVMPRTSLAPLPLSSFPATHVHAHTNTTHNQYPRRIAATHLQSALMAHEEATFRAGWRAAVSVPRIPSNVNYWLPSQSSAADSSSNAMHDVWPIMWEEDATAAASGGSAFPLSVTEATRLFNNWYGEQYSSSSVAVAAKEPTPPSSGALAQNLSQSTRHVSVPDRLSGCIEMLSAMDQWAASGGELAGPEREDGKESAWETLSSTRLVWVPDAAESFVTAFPRFVLERSVRIPLLALEASQQQLLERHIKNKDGKRQENCAHISGTENASAAPHPSYTFYHTPIDHVRSGTYFVLDTFSPYFGRVFLVPTFKHLLSGAQCAVSLVGISAKLAQVVCVPRPPKDDAHLVVERKAWCMPQAEEQLRAVAMPEFLPNPHSAGFGTHAPTPTGAPSSLATQYGLMPTLIEPVGNDANPSSSGERRGDGVSAAVAARYHTLFTVPAGTASPTLASVSGTGTASLLEGTTPSPLIGFGFIHGEVEKDPSGVIVSVAHKSRSERTRESQPSWALKLLTRQDVTQVRGQLHRHHRRHNPNPYYFSAALLWSLCGRVEGMPVIGKERRSPPEWAKNGTRQVKFRLPSRSSSSDSTEADRTPTTVDRPSGIYGKREHLVPSDERRLHQASRRGALSPEAAELVQDLRSQFIRDQKYLRRVASTQLDPSSSAARFIFHSDALRFVKQTQVVGRLGLRAAYAASPTSALVCSPALWRSADPPAEPGRTTVSGVKYNSRPEDSCPYDIKGPEQRILTAAKSLGMEAPSYAQYRRQWCGPNPPTALQSTFGMPITDFMCVDPFQTEGLLGCSSGRVSSDTSEVKRKSKRDADDKDKESQFADDSQFVLAQLRRAQQESLQTEESRVKKTKGPAAPPRAPTVGNRDIVLVDEADAASHANEAAVALSLSNDVLRHDLDAHETPLHLACLVHQNTPRSLSLHSAELALFLMQTRTQRLEMEELML